MRSFNKSSMQDSVKTLRPFYDIAVNFHEYSIKGMEKIPKGENCIFAINHSLATYDAVLFSGYIYLAESIWIRPVLDNIIFKIPILQKLFNLFFPVQGKFDVLKDILEQGDSILVAPGGMKEAIKGSSEKYQIKWENRKGFIKLSIMTGKPIILAGCPEADNLYDISDSPLTDFIYKKFKFPFVFAKGKYKYLPFLPKKIKLTHYIEGPFYPPKYNGGDDLNKKIDEFHLYICEIMKNLLLKHKK